MKTPIFDTLKNLIEKEISFHTPGHKGRNTLIEWSKYIPYIDTTEIEGTDNLLEPRGIIKKSQDLTAKVFGAKMSLYGVNGSTGNIYAAMATIAQPGDKVLVQRNSHKAIYNSMILNRLEPIYIYPNYNEEHKLFTGLNPYDIEIALKENPDIKAVIITYPDYYGICSDIEKIVNIVHKYNKILMVDEAHGSHIGFSKRLPISALKAGADIVIHSTHKTLPSFTQTSILHVGTDKIDLNRLKSNFALYTTTSPSYLLMVSNEIAVAYMDGQGRKILDQSIDKVEDTIKRLQSIDRVSVFTGDNKDKTIYNKDKTKILFKIDGITGSRLEDILRADYNINLEMSDYYYGLALTTLMNTNEDYETFLNAIEDIAKTKAYKKIEHIDINILKPVIRKDISSTYYGNKAQVSLKESIGRISGSYIIPYPPGIPLIVPGEEITKELYDHITFIMENSIEINGLMGYNKDQIVVAE
ncbi:aminotransferase class I/II-fold pyridoxal phosphate-dependent enzyme [Wansuia hejianensis]|uniref:Aminotransferase class I/II-fold pyridoxal phosphate-dependent enzyme n=1 Tax=Wansuia hejianensis TaxID=2763667 RepID=A0A926EXN6_9FIRM|nr:aminotransferase class I/II-fold pyridoxal phosphate-dependent enzyme [Wansuia hejianensis]